MSHFAKVENGLVTQVIVAEPDFISTGALGDPAAWIQTSYNTRGGVHYDQDGQPDALGLRGNYAGVGYTYDPVNDVFVAPQPDPTWVLDVVTSTWYDPTGEKPIIAFTEPAPVEPVVEPVVEPAIIEPVVEVPVEQPSIQ